MKIFYIVGSNIRLCVYKVVTKGKGTNGVRLVIPSAQRDNINEKEIFSSLKSSCSNVLFLSQDEAISFAEKHIRKNNKLFEAAPVIFEIKANYKIIQKPFNICSNFFCHNLISKKIDNCLYGEFHSYKVVLSDIQLIDYVFSVCYPDNITREAVSNQNYNDNVETEFNIDNLSFKFKDIGERSREFFKEIIEAGDNFNDEYVYNSIQSKIKVTEDNKAKQKVCTRERQMTINK